jgi:hypothetical protein
MNATEFHHEEHEAHEGRPGMPVFFLSFFAVVVSALGGGVSVVVVVSALEY